MHKILSLLIFLSLGLLTNGFGQVLENYDSKWRPAKEAAWWENNDQLEVLVNVRDFPKSQFELTLPSQATLFVDGKLIELFPTDTVLHWPVEEVWRLSKKDSVLFTVTHSQVTPNSVGLKKVVFESKQVDTTEKAQEMMIARTSILPLKDFFVVVFVLIVMFLAVYRLAYPYLFSILIQPVALINAEDFSDTGSLQKFFSPDILFYVLLVSMMISQVGVVALSVETNWVMNWTKGDFFSLLILWVIGVVLVFLFFILKFIGVRFAGYLFELGKSDFSHYFYLLRLIVFGVTIVLLVASYYLINDFNELGSVLTFLFQFFFWFYLLGILGLSLIMMNRLSFKKYHLFIYLCIAEFVPFLILSKWIVMMIQ
ncbi:DUF4271 domain-containing protein [Algoriphagus sanaruensis]|uniref:DUF4271 domain-containing protein n=1 Tax=Algoriphagus sanaruensis TaxID=1727163 RepID=A0A142EIT0_9BACT|nr:DUF4271 domain-containing protein [Algoriphagus sanaruensis]AMQ55035.1 hypothetical protein AO498_01435 [Algoriphagus sanaruensis]